MAPSDNAENAKLAGEIFTRTGIAIDPQDPIFLLVALNRLVLEDQKSDLENLRAEMSMDLTRKVGQLAQAGTDYVQRLEQYRDSYTAQIRDAAESDRAELERWMIKKSVEAVAGVTDHASATVRRSVQEAVKQEISAPLMGASLRLIAVCVIAGVLGALITFGGLWWAMGAEMKEQIKYGRVIAEAWPKLDRQAQDIINQTAQGK